MWQSSSYWRCWEPAFPQHMHKRRPHSIGRWRPLSAPAPAPAADESRAVGGTTSVSLGEGGATVFTRDTVDQRAVYAQALNGVIAWRKDALADANIKLPYNGTYLTVPEYLQEIGMTESEYLTRSGRMRLS